MATGSRVGDDVARQRQGARRLGITYETYRRHVLDGERWCSGERRWLSSSAFRPSRGYDRNTLCIACRTEYHRQYDAQRRETRRAS